VADLIDAAKRLAGCDTTPCEDGTGRCVFCPGGRGGYSVADGKVLHEDACPLVNMPAIVAALEAAAALADALRDAASDVHVEYCGGNDHVWSCERATAALAAYEAAPSSCPPFRSDVD
jgi:hypothetical protein